MPESMQIGKFKREELVYADCSILCGLSKNEYSESHQKCMEGSALFVHDT